jgi:indoleacetamide hydrolase
LQLREDNRVKSGPTVLSLAADLAAGRVTSRALVEQALAAIVDPAGEGARVFLEVDAEGARRAADAQDQLRQAGYTLSPLAGLPISIKDLFDIRGQRTRGGSAVLNDQPAASSDATIVHRLRQAGAVLIGRTNMTEFAFSGVGINPHYGTPGNPFDRARIPGGSSSGAGVSVADGMAVVAIGTDTGGSVRIPAAHCGITGFRPTTLRWSQSGIVPISHTRDTAGPMARSVGDCVLLDGIVTGGPTELRPARLEGLRIGVPRGYFWETLDAELAQILEGTLAKLRAAGAVLVEGDVADVGALDHAAGFPIALYETIADLNQYLTEHDTGLDFAGLVAQVKSPPVKDILASLLGDMAVPEAAYQEAVTKHRPALQETYRRAFREHGVEVIAFPTTPMPAATTGEEETVLVNGTAVPTFFTYIRNTSPGSVAGIPGLSLPAGMTKAGLPVGLEIDGPEGSDQQVLAIGLALETILPKLPAPKI